jgi:hypothetical protein
MGCEARPTCSKQSVCRIAPLALQVPRHDVVSHLKHGGTLWRSKEDGLRGGRLDEPAPCNTHTCRPTNQLKRMYAQIYARARMRVHISQSHKPPLVGRIHSLLCWHWQPDMYIISGYLVKYENQPTKTLWKGTELVGPPT